MSRPPRCCGCGLLIDKPQDWRELTETDELCPPCRTRRVREHLALLDTEAADLLRSILPITHYGLLDAELTDRALAYGRVAESALVERLAAPIRIPSDADVTITLYDAGVQNHLSRVRGQTDWYAVVETTPPSARFASPWDYQDDGPGGPELHTADFVAAVEWIRETAAAHLARQRAEADAAEAAHVQAEKEARDARRRAR